MFETIERPSAGKPMRAAWGARLVDRVNELCAATSPGMLAREGLGGTGAEPTPASRRNPRPSSVSVKIKLPFDPVFEETETTDEDGKKKKEVKLKSVGLGLIPWGRRFYVVVPQLDDSAKQTAALVGLEITHPTSAIAAPTARIIAVGGSTVTENGVHAWGNGNNTKDVTVLPLYSFKDGNIGIDYRCYLALAVRE